MLLTSKSRSRKEYVIPTDNIIVLDYFFNLTKKSYLIGRLQYNLTQFCGYLVVATFLGHPVLFSCNTAVQFEYNVCVNITLWIYKQNNDMTSNKNYTRLQMHVTADNL